MEAIHTARSLLRSSRLRQQNAYSASVQTLPPSRLKFRKKASMPVNSRSVQADEGFGGPDRRLDTEERLAPVSIQDWVSERRSNTCGSVADASERMKRSRLKGSYFNTLVAMQVLGAILQLTALALLGYIRL